jgi:anti-sigma factor RsiW
MRDLFDDPGCEAASDALPDLVHGRLASADRERAEHHVARCAACAAELAMLERVAATTRAATPRLDLDAIAAAVRAGTTPPNRAATRELRATAAAGRTSVLPPGIGTPGRWRVGARARAVFAAVLVAVGAGAVWTGRGGSVDGAGPREVAGATVTAPGTGPAAPGRPEGDSGARAPRTAPVPPPPVLAQSDPGLGAAFDDLTDDELQAVIAAIGGDGAAGDGDVELLDPELFGPEYGEVEPGEGG